LGLDFICHDQKYHGNIGFLFDDKNDEPTFTFYVTKSFDTGNKRYFGRKNLLERTELNYIENNSLQILERAVSVYHAMADSELTRVINL